MLCCVPWFPPRSDSQRGASSDSQPRQNWQIVNVMLREWLGGGSPASATLFALQSRRSPRFIAAVQPLLLILSLDSSPCAREGHPIACATFCLWRGKGGACERRSWRGGATLSPLRSPRRFAAQPDFHWWRKFGQELNKSFPILRAAPITGSVSRSVDSWRPHSQTTSYQKTN